MRALHHPLLVVPFWYTESKGTRNSLSRLVLLLYPSSSLGCPSFELHLSTKGTPPMASETPQRFPPPPTHLRTVSTSRNVPCPKCPNVSNVPCPKCPLVPPWCMINRSMLKGTPLISSETPGGASSSTSSPENGL